MSSSCGLPGVSSGNDSIPADGPRFLMVTDNDHEVVSYTALVIFNWTRTLESPTGGRSLARLATFRWHEKANLASSDFHWSPSDIAGRFALSDLHAGLRSDSHRPHGG